MSSGSRTQSTTDRLAVMWTRPSRLKATLDARVEDPKAGEDRRRRGVAEGKPTPAHEQREDYEAGAELDRQQRERRDFVRGALADDGSQAPARGGQDQGEDGSPGGHERTPGAGGWTVGAVIADLQSSSQQE